MALFFMADAHFHCSMDSLLVGLARTLKIPRLTGERLQNPKCPEPQESLLWEFSDSEWETFLTFLSKKDKLEKPLENRNL